MWPRHMAGDVVIHRGKKQNKRKVNTMWTSVSSIFSFSSGALRISPMLTGITLCARWGPPCKLTGWVAEGDSSDGTISHTSS